ncbi:hypothetical protein HY285_04880 [Candidatus Peregrinibacteria bacterium]|nr:hypothetical protein [Candidatus Peregrinibacteria bacterium]MBI3816845.1 hypothetical protein [Candidatus Peregrinibacteria bacterium]
MSIRNPQKTRPEEWEKDLDFFSERKDLFDHIMVNEDLDAVVELLKQKVPGLKSA